MKKHTGAAAVILAGALWGIISIFVRALTAAGLDSLQIMLLRAGLSALGLGLVFLLKDPSLFKIRLRDIWMFVGTGVISLTCFSWCYFTAIVECGASEAVVLLYTSPIFVMLISAPLFGERLTLRKIAALIMTFTGCVLVAGLVGGGHAMSVRGILLGLGSGLGYGLYSIFSRFALRRYGALTITFYTFVFSFGALLFITPPGTMLTLMGSKQWLFAAAEAAVCTVAPYLLYTYGLGRMETTHAAILVTVEPLVGALLGILAYGEDCGLSKICGMALIFAAIILLSLPAGDARRRSNTVTK